MWFQKLTQLGTLSCPKRGTYPPFARAFSVEFKIPPHCPSLEEGLEGLALRRMAATAETDMVAPTGMDARVYFLRLQEVRPHI